MIGNDVDDLPGFDFTADVEHKIAPPSSNAFLGIESQLGLPIGSTQKGLDDAKAEAKRIKEQTKALVAQTKAYEAKERANNSLPVAMFTVESLDQDRARILKEANTVYDVAKSFLDRMQEQLDNTIMPSERMWNAAATMINSVTASLEKLNSITTQYRQEEEMKAFKVEQQQSEGGNEVQQFDFNPQQMNKLMETWMDELTENVNNEIASDAAARQDAAAKAITQQVEGKDV